MKLLAIDPGSTHSAYVVIETDDLAPKWFDKIDNEELLELPYLKNSPHVAIEMVAHYGSGMPAGKTVFDTCVWIGRFWQAAHDAAAEYYRIVGTEQPLRVDLVPRKTVVTHLCGSSKANDGNVIQALIDRFAPDTGNHGKGYKNLPGWFYGFAGDVWQCYALAVYVADTLAVKTHA